VVRHPIVQAIVQAYQLSSSAAEKRQPSASDSRKTNDQ
jgi:hypothetical protein